MVLAAIFLSVVLDFSVVRGVGKSSSRSFRPMNGGGCFLSFGATLATVCRSGDDLAELFSSRKNSAFRDQFTLVLKSFLQRSR